MSIKNTKGNAAVHLLDKICYMCEGTPRPSGCQIFAEEIIEYCNARSDEI